MEIHLRGRTALITGSTKGVGRAIAESLAEAGAKVILHGRARTEQAEQVLSRCRELGPGAEFITGDLSAPTEAAVADVFQQALAVAPEIDTLVNNAGTYIDKPYLEMDWETYEKTMRLNVASPYFLTQAFARRWVENQTSGRVLMIGSINGRLAEQVHTAYDASKGAVEMMVKSLCVSLAPHNIRVNGLAPGLVVTPLTSILEEDPRFRRWMNWHTPNGETPGPEVCGEGAVYLLSDAAKHVHGHMLLVDGGMSAWQQPDPPDSWEQ